MTRRIFDSLQENDKTAKRIFMRYIIIMFQSKNDLVAGSKPIVFAVDLKASIHVRHTTPMVEYVLYSIIFTTVFWRLKVRKGDWCSPNFVTARSQKRCKQTAYLQFYRVISAPLSTMQLVIGRRSAALRRHQRRREQLRGNEIQWNTNTRRQLFDVFRLPSQCQRFTADVYSRVWHRMSRLLMGSV